MHFLKSSVLSFIPTFFLSLFLFSCSVYKSPDRKVFESRISNFDVQNLKLLQCSETSIKDFATASRLVNVDHSLDDPEFMWEYQINDRSVFESNKSKGTYCIYENI